MPCALLNVIKCRNRRKAAHPHHKMNEPDDRSPSSNSSGIGLAQTFSIDVCKACYACLITATATCNCCSTY